MAALTPMMYSIGFALLKRAVAWLIETQILETIRGGVALLLSEDLPPAEKHARVKAMARSVESELHAGARRLPGTVLSIAIGVVYLELTKQGPTS
jgi:hypothetical protein